MVAIAEIVGRLVADIGIKDFTEVISGDITAAATPSAWFGNRLTRGRQRPIAELQP